MTGSVGNTFRLAGWQVEADTRTISFGDKCQRLSPRAMAVLEILVEADGHVVSRETLLEKVWPDVTVGEESVTTAVSELRRAFGETRGTAKVIETIQKSGYRLVQPVTRDDETLRLGSPIAFEGATDRDLDALLVCHEVRRLRQSHGPLAYPDALVLCAEAIEEAPNLAIARAEYAITSALHSLYCGGQQDKLQDALEMAEKAVTLRPDLPDGHHALGVTQSALNNRFAARFAYQTALSLGPNDGEVFFQCARALLGFGEIHNAARAAERSAVLLTDCYRPLYVAASAHQLLGNHKRTAILLNAALGRLERRLATDPEEPRALNAMATILAWRGQPEAALEISDRLEARGQSILYYRAATAAFAGQTTDALLGIERLIERGYRQTGWLTYHPGFAQLSGEPRYRRLRQQLEAA
ncbi:MAG: winged helix-turn-helix domain-containing protein [Pseudomonadota bacterium]